MMGDPWEVTARTPHPWLITMGPVPSSCLPREVAAERSCVSVQPARLLSEGAGGGQDLACPLRILRWCEGGWTPRARCWRGESAAPPEPSVPSTPSAGSAPGGVRRPCPVEFADTVALVCVSSPCPGARLAEGQAAPWLGECLALIPDSRTLTLASVT